MLLSCPVLRSKIQMPGVSFRSHSNAPCTQRCLSRELLTLVVTSYQVLLLLRKEIREKNEREDKECHGTPDAQSEHSALSLPLFAVSHLFSSQGHVRSSFLAHKDERIGWFEIMPDRGGDNGPLRTNRCRRRSVRAPQCLITPVRKADAEVHLAPYPDPSPVVN